MNIGVDIELLFDNDFLEVIKHYNGIEKLFLFLPNNIQLLNKSKELLKDKRLLSLFDEIITCDQKYFNDLAKNRNMGYIISKNTEFLNLFDKIKHINYDNKDILKIIKAENELRRKNIKDPITVLSGIPSIDKIWNRNFSVNQANINIDRNMNIYEYIYSNVVNNLDAPAIIYFDKKISFRELFANADNYANALLQQGIKKDDVVTISMPNTPEACIAILAINKIGAISSMLHPMLKHDEINDVLKETNSKYILTTEVSKNEILKSLNNTFVQKVVIAPVSHSMPCKIKIAYNLKMKIDNIKNKLQLSSLSIATRMIPKKYKLIRNSLNQTITDLSKYKNVPNDITTTWNKEIKNNMNNCKIENIQNKKNQTAFLLRTGGTTGISKMTCITNNNCIANIEQLKYTIPSYKPFEVIEGITPLFHGFGLVDTILTAWAVNLTVDLHPKYNKKTFNKAVLKNKPVLILGVPTLFKSMINNPMYKNKDLSFLKVMISGGDKLNDKLRDEINEWKSEHNATNPIFSGFGLTESTASISFSGLNSTDKSSVGSPLPLNNIKIVDPETNEELGYNEIGELCVSGPAVMKEYYKNDDETKENLRLENGKIWLHTGDICKINNSGEICFVDRNKGVIIVSGVNVYRNDIESVINNLKEVESSAVIGIPHSYSMNVPKAYVVLKDDAILTDELKQEFMDYCNEHLDRYQRISEFEQIEEMPLTKMQKIDYKELEHRQKIKR